MEICVFFCATLTTVFLSLKLVSASNQVYLLNAHFE